MVAVRKPGRVDASRAEPAKRDSDPWAMIDIFPLPTFICGAEGVLVRYNKRAEELWGFAPELETNQRFGGAHRVYDTEGRPIPVEERPVARVLRTGNGIRDLELILERRDGMRIRVLVNIQPLFDDQGAIVGAVNCMQDITLSRRVEEAWRESVQRLAATYAHAAIGITEVDEDGRLLRVNETTCVITGYSREELLQTSIFDITHPDDQDWDRNNHYQQTRGGADSYVVEKRLVRKDGRVIWVDVRSSTVRDAAGRFLYGIRVVHDITHRKEAEQRQKLLLDELNHRVKNTLATVQSLATQTLRGAGSPEQFRHAFEARLVALSKTHDLLTSHSWQGAELEEIIARQLEPYAADPKRIVLQGEAVALTPRAALTLSMIFHELATNAAKYGALSTSAGRLEVCWRVEPASDASWPMTAPALPAADAPGLPADAPVRPACVALTWHETGGPTVAPPQRRGFGSRLIERSTRELDGDAKLEFAPAGLRYSVTIPLTRANSPSV
jgi:PAS domain S-box-containing protein